MASMKHKVPGFLFAIVLSIAITTTVGCASNRVAKDLVDYVNQDILGIAELEGNALRSYAAVVGENYTTDEAVYTAMKNEVVPTYKRFLDLLKTISRQTEEVKELHAIYVRGADMMYNGFRTKLMGLENKDENIIRMANAQIEDGRVITDKWRDELFALAKKHGVVQKEKD